MIATLVITLVAACVWLATGDDPPVANADTTAQDPTATGAIPGLTPSATSLQFRTSSLERLLKAAAAPARAIAQQDPFVTVSANGNRTKRVVRGNRSSGLHVGGIFVSSNQRGALIDRKVYFEGDRLKDGTQLVKVGRSHIELKLRDRVWTVPLAILVNENTSEE